MACRTLGGCFVGLLLGLSAAQAEEKVTGIEWLAPH